MMRRFGLRDDQWERIKDLLPGREGSVGVTAADNRLFVEAVLYRYRTGMPWRDLPERLGDGRTCTDASAAGLRLVCGRGSFSTSQQTPTTNMRCSTARLYAPISIAPAPKKSRRRPGDRALARRTEHQDPYTGRCARQSARLFPDRRRSTRPSGGRPTAAYDGGRMLIADKAFDADARVLEPLAAAGKNAVIPPRANRSSLRDYDRQPDGERHLIENFFAKIKQFRAIATRYEKTARNFLAAVHLVASVIWLN